MNSFDLNLIYLVMVNSLTNKLELLRKFQKEIWEECDPKAQEGFKLRISNFHKEKTIISKYELTCLVNFFLGLLVSSRLKKTLTINIILDDDLGDNLGLCSTDDTTRSPKNFEIRLKVAKSRSKADILKTLAHELVHVKQYAKNELFDHIKAGVVTYQKVRYYIDTIDYYAQPWEIEAFAKQESLYAIYEKSELFKRFNNLN